MKAGRVAMGVFYVAAGVMHLVLKHAYERAVPQVLPAHGTIVVLSGVAEMAGGVGVLVPATRRAAAWGLVALLVAVFPANVSMALRPGDFPELPGWMLWARLPLQAPLIWWAWWYTRRADTTTPAAKAISETGLGL